MPDITLGIERQSAHHGIPFAGLDGLHHFPRIGRTDLLHRLRPDLAAANILVDGHELGTLKLRDYRSQLGVVLQDNFMFDGTIAENIRFSRPRASMDDVKMVSAIAHCDEFIQKFPQKYETVVGERGVKLSGGQRQRVAIARAVLADPRILILDEATSSLDSESEALIQDGLQTLREGRTSFVIAHRLSTIRSADQILVLEAGEIVERGTHAELLANQGLYAAFADEQRLESEIAALEADLPAPDGDGAQALRGAASKAVPA